MTSDNKFMLYEDSKPISVVKTLSEAKEIVEHKVNKFTEYKVELNAAPAKTRVWLYDNNVDDWVEQI